MLLQWLDECCERVDQDGLAAKDTFRSLFASWVAFVKQRGGGEPGSSINFAKKMRKRGFVAIADDPAFKGKGFIGIRVRRWISEGLDDQ